MYLYEREKDKINVYKMTPNDQKLAEFKKREMQAIPFNETFFRAQTNDSNRKILEDTSQLILWGRLGFSREDIIRRYTYYYHHMTNYEMTESALIVLG